MTMDTTSSSRIASLFHGLFYERASWIETRKPYKTAPNAAACVPLRYLLAIFVL
jgi:hypothetical protein